MFENIVGNSKTKEFLTVAIKKGNVSHSYMFVGKSGIGKKLFAREFARNVMLSEANREKDMTSIQDYKEIIPDGNSIKILQVRDLQEDIAEKPVQCARKIYVIDNADSMTEESQNCLLKTLEEPPEYAMIILIVANENMMLETIKSRCVIVKFNELTNEELKQYLEKNYTSTNYNMKDANISQILEGSLEKIDNIEKKYKEYKELEKIVETIEKGKMIDIFNDSDLLYTSKDDIMDLLDYLNMLYLQKRNSKAVKIIENTKKKILANNNYEMCIDDLIMKLGRINEIKQ